MNLQELRNQQHLTQEELAEKSGISVRTIQRIEAGQAPKGHTARALAKALNVEVDTMTPFGGTGDTLNFTLVKLINLSSLPLTFLPIANILAPLLIMFFTKQFNPLTRQILSLQIFWTILSTILFFLAALLKNALGLTNVFTLWVMIVLLLSNVVLIIVNTASLDRSQKLYFSLNFSFI